jgi:hypothetical protein
MEGPSMISQRVRPRPIILSWLLTFSALTFLAILPGPAGATTRHAKLQWRPGWLPGDPETATSGPAPIWARSAPTRAGLFISIDPITHRPIAPTPEQIRAWNDQQAHDALLAPTRPLTVQRLPNGGEIIHLNGAFRSYSIARRAPDGHITTDCAPDPARARKILAQPAPELK